MCRDWEPPEQTPQEREAEELWLEQIHAQFDNEKREPVWGRPIATLEELRAVTDPVHQGVVQNTEGE